MVNGRAPKPHPLWWPHGAISRKRAQGKLRSDPLAGETEELIEAVVKVMEVAEGGHRQLGQALLRRWMLLLRRRTRRRRG